jgi:hypothetical protein
MRAIRCLRTVSREARGQGDLVEKTVEAAAGTYLGDVLLRNRSAKETKQLMALVDLFHVYGISVVFDVIYNHSGGDFGAEGIYFKVVDLLKFRPIQFCMFLKSLVGAEEMKRMMVKAILLAQQEG